MTSHQPRLKVKSTGNGSGGYARFVVWRVAKKDEGSEGAGSREKEHKEVSDEGVSDTDSVRE